MVGYPDDTVHRSPLLNPMEHQPALELKDQYVDLPPFRSSKDFPPTPRRNRLPDLYPKCLEALKNSNAARRILRERMHRNKEVLTAVQAEIQRFQNELSDQAEARLRLHEINKQLVSALRDIDRVADDFSATVVEAHGSESQAGRRVTLNAMVVRIKEIIRSWRKLAHETKQKLAGRDD